MLDLRTFGFVCLHLACTEHAHSPVQLVGRVCYIRMVRWDVDGAHPSHSLNEQGWNELWTYVFWLEHAHSAV